MVIIEVCPVCGGELQQNARKFPSRPLMEMELEGIHFVGSALVQYAQCSQCKVYVQSPRMSDEDIVTYYRNGLYRTWLGMSAEALDRDEHLRANMDAAIVKKFIGDVSSHLDFGSSRGYFLQWVGAGIQVGIESNSEYNVNEDAYVVPGWLELDPNTTYDLVSAIHSLEHTADPMSILQEMSRRSNRWVVVEVPSEESPGGWGRLAHTFHFPEETFFLMAEKAGLKVTTIMHTPHTFVIMEKNGVPVELPTHEMEMAHG